MGLVFRFIQEQYIQASLFMLAQGEFSFNEALSSLAMILKRYVVFGDDQVSF